MSESIDTLFAGEAGTVWRYFAEISATPRPSKNEEQIRDYLLAKAREKQWTTRTDEVGNVVISIPGHGRLSNAPTLVLQSHMDMVCEKNSDVEHDFMKDPIKLVLDDGWVKADGTTLGADNGIGVALSLAVADDQLLNRLPLELLITVDEETGLTGAMGLDPELVTGRHVLNLDSEEDWLFIVGCAGGIDLEATFPVDTSGGAYDPVMTIHVRGLRGGHSGIQIDEGRENAIRVAATLINRLRSTRPTFALHAIEGGNKRNAIPRECKLLVSGVPEVALRDAADAILQEIIGHETSAVIEIAESAEVPKQVLPVGVMDMLLRAPNGVIARDRAMPESIETSNNLAVVTQDVTHVHMHMHARSSSEDGKQTVVRQVEQLVKGLGGKLEVHGSYPGWEPDSSTSLLRKARSIYREMFEKDAESMSIHAGLESGIIGARLETTELLSYGPTIVDPHSPDERLEVASVEKVYGFLKNFVGQPMA